MEPVADHYSLNRWPKPPVVLNRNQVQAREEWMRYWHEILPNRYAAIERFNHGFPARQHKEQKRIRTLEIGAGLGEHVAWENLDNQDYHLFEYRKDWCEILREKFSQLDVCHGDIQCKTKYEGNFFDRIVAIHVLEHLPDLPLAVDEFSRILKPDGHLDVVLPCEGGWAYEFARQISSARMFKKKFGMDYAPIIRAEHVNTLPEILYVLRVKGWHAIVSSYFPLKIPLWSINLCIGMRLQRQV